MRDIAGWFVLLGLLMSVAANAQRTANVRGEYTYYAPSNVTLDEAKLRAFEAAKVEALAAEFGTLVERRNTTVVSNTNGHSQNSFYSLGESEVRGEFISVDEPQYEVSYAEGMTIVACRVSGRAREVTIAKPQFSAHLLRNGTDDRFESDTFRDGDEFYLSFQSPADGYLAVYFLDAERTAYCLVPSATYDIYPIRAGRRYVFFDAHHDNGVGAPPTEEMKVTASHGREINQVVVLFSPQPFTKALDGVRDRQLPPVLDYRDFQRWLSHCRRADRQMQIESHYITIDQQNK